MCTPRKTCKSFLGFSFLLCLFVAGIDFVQGRYYFVGGRQGWDLYPELIRWPQGKHFKAGDVLVFNYNTEGGNLFSPVRVDKAGYEKCDPSVLKMSDRFNGTGHDRMRLTKGYNCFISAVQDYCGYGMKIAVYAW
ncbi:hypothetical protein MKW92_052185 [Papaver armeniacum]|nr:hypothetical protein MKW92_052185 [Papaver armeniacum]